MVLLLAMAPLNALDSVSSVNAQYASIHAPPGEAITIIDQQITSQYLIEAPAVNYQVARGVGVPVKELIGESKICSLYNIPTFAYATYGRVDLKLYYDCGFLQSQDVYNYSGDLGLRWAPSVII